MHNHVTLMDPGEDSFFFFPLNPIMGKLPPHSHFSFNAAKAIVADPDDDVVY
jgi:hypothetical protein